MEYTPVIFLLGRIIFGGYFLMNGWNHFKNLPGLTGYAASKGVPLPKLAVGVTGVLLAVSGLGVLLGVFVPYALLALVIFLGPVSFMMHAFWKVSDPMQKMVEQVNFMKNMALLGAALMLLSTPETWPYSL